MTVSPGELAQETTARQGAGPVGADLLTQAISHVAGHLDRSIPPGERLRTIWAGVVASRDLAAADVIVAEFMQLSQSSGLVSDLGRHASEQIGHVIRWAMLDRNPFD